ncbi:hypothetical protein PG989_001301 [Apiospora arundinis]
MGRFLDVSYTNGIDCNVYPSELGNGLGYRSGHRLLASDVDYQPKKTELDMIRTDSVCRLCKPLLVYVCQTER